MTSRPRAVLTVAALAGTAAISVVLTGPVLGGDRTEHNRTIGYGQVKFDGLGPERWAARARVARRHVDELRDQVAGLQRALHRQRQVVLRDPTVVEAINLACATYGWCSTLWRKARCETGGTFDPRALNSSGAAGLFQFMPSTWSSTPYGRFSVFDPVANALAAGWMHDQGRGSEWSCR